MDRHVENIRLGTHHSHSHTSKNQHILHRLAANQITRPLQWTTRRREAQKAAATFAIFVRVKS